MSLQAKVDLKTINAKGMPAMVLAAPKDPIVQLYISKEVMDLLGISQENRLTFSKDGKWQPDNRGKYLLTNLTPVTVITAYGPV